MAAISFIFRCQIVNKIYEHDHIATRITNLHQFVEEYVNIFVIHYIFINIYANNVGAINNR